jgi:PAS domain S-box-containing protein
VAGWHSQLGCDADCVYAPQTALEVMRADTPVLLPGSDKGQAGFLKSHHVTKAKGAYMEGQQADKPTSTGLRNGRLTIGYLALSISEDLSYARWSGVADTAWKQGANLICFRGGPLHEPIGLHRQATPLYDLPGPEIVDGWVVGNVVADGPASLTKFRDFCAKQSGLPMVSIRESLPDIPYVPLDNYQGMREAMVHLVEVHRYRRIAFLRGPEAHPYAQERYRAYTDVLKEYGLPFDPNLVAPPRDWNEPAIQVLLDERKLRPALDLEAIVAVNDWMALDTLRKLQAQGIRIPGDVAIVGFNDDLEGQGIAPPLTSVALPFYEQGQRALEMLLALLVSDRVPEQAALHAKLMVRQSCGCTSTAVAQAAVGSVAIAKGSLDMALAARQAEILAEAMQRLGPTQGQASEWVERLLGRFAAEVQRQASGEFVRELDNILRQVYLADGDVAAWQHVVSTLRRRVLPYLNSAEQLRAEDLGHQARVLIGEMAQRAETQRAWQARRQAQTLREICQALITTFDMGKLMNVLADQLPSLDIPSCYVCLYEDPSRPTEWSRLMLAYNERGRVKLEPEGRRFLSRQLIPEGIISPERQYSFVAEALCFQDQQLGFVLFEVGTRDGKIYEMLRDQISSALQGALLVQRVRERSAELARQQYILDTFMENVPDRIYFKDLNSQITRANKSHALQIGLSDPSEEIGKSDFDFFPEKQASAKYEQEQEIIRTGQPISLEEESVLPDRRAGWVLTTKMPLRDEQGNIIGTFGISRDITELKQTQAALERAYAEVEQQVQERTAQLRHEIMERKQAEEEVQRLNAELEQRVIERTVQLEMTIKELEAFSYSVSHDLRAPLRAIDGFSRILLENHASQLQPEVAHHLRTIFESTQQMGRLIDGLLALSRLSRQPLHKQEIASAELVRQALESLSNEQAGRRVEVSMGELPACQGDPMLLRQVWVNLLSNAFKFTRRREAAQIRIGGMEREGETVYFVQDNGAGFDMQYAGKLFGVFQRLHSAQEYDGTGVGLAVVQRIVHRHGGRVWAEAVPGEGATFYFTLK